MKFFYSLFLALVTFGAIASPEVKVINQWVHPAEKHRDYESTQERTRPVIMGDILYVASLSGEVYAAHRLEGYKLWKRKMAAGIEGSLTYGRSKVIVGDLAGNLSALNSRDGSDYWSFKINGEWLAPATLSRDKVFVATSNDELYALSETQGKEIWHYSHRGDEKMTIRGMGSPVVMGDEVFQGFSNGDLVALSAGQGKVLWVKHLKTKDRFYDVDMTPYVDEKSVIVGTFDGKVYSLDRATGGIQWVYPVGSYGGFWLENDRVYFSGLDNQFYCLNREHGTLIWKTPFESGVGVTPAKVGDYLVIPTSSDPVYVLRPSDGKIIWTGNLGTGTLSPVLAAPESWFYVISNFGNLFSFQLTKTNPVDLGPEKLATPSAILREFSKSDINSKRS
jgi:outer membrane protein assembly factor BamB